MPAIFHRPIDEEEVAADKDDEAHDGAGHVGGVAGQVSVNNFVKRLEMSYLNLHHKHLTNIFQTLPCYSLTR